MRSPGAPWNGSPLQRPRPAAGPPRLQDQQDDEPEPHQGRRPGQHPRRQVR